MKSILIRDTTREEREQIVRQSLWGDCGIECEFCSGCDNRGGGTIADKRSMAKGKNRLIWKEDGIK